MHGVLAGLALAAALAAQQGAALPRVDNATVTIEGRVVDSLGEGVPAAQVWVVAWPEMANELARAVADGEGYFKFARVPKRDYLHVQATADGHDVGRDYPRDGVARVELREAVTLSGTLRDSTGKAVVGATVRELVESRDQSAADVFATTDATGAFALSRVPVGPVRVAAVVPGEGLYETRLVAVADAEVQLARDQRPRTSIELAVEGMPPSLLSSISVQLLPDRMYSRLPPPWHKPAFRDAQTVTLLDVPDTDYQVTMTSPTHALASGASQLAHGKGPHRVAFTATPNAGVEAMRCPARVVGPDGAPLPGLQFELRSMSGGAARASATSGEDGAMVFESPLPKGTRVVVQCLDDRWVVDQHKKGPSNERRLLRYHEGTIDPGNVFDLHVVAAGTVTGRLKLPDGRPAALVRVELQETLAGRMPEWMAMANATSERDGTFSFRCLHHLPDLVRVHTSTNAGSVTGEAFALQEPGARVDVGDVRLEAPAVIEGVVRDAKKSVAIGVRVWLRDWDLATGKPHSGDLVETTTDRQGRYRFVGVPTGGAYLQVLTSLDRDTNDRAVEPFAVEAGKRYAFDLQTPAR